MKTIHAWFALSVILLGMAALLSRLSRPNHKMAVSEDQMASIPSAEAVTQALCHSTSPIKTIREISVGLSQSKPAIRQPSVGAASVNLESPVDSQDVDQSRDWARSHPAEALVWLEDAPDSAQRFAVAEIVCPQLAATNPAAAVKLTEKCLGDDTNNAVQYLLGTVAQIWAEQDIKSATAWALAKPAGEGRNLLLQHITFAESKTDPVEAAQLISQQMSPGSFQSEAAVTLVYQWALQDPKSALAWAESFPTGDLRNRAINEVKNVIATSADKPTSN